MLLAQTRFLETYDGETSHTERVRFRTVGDATCTGCVESDADTVEKVIEEPRRGSPSAAPRAPTIVFPEAGMEDRKEGTSDDYPHRSELLRLATAGSVDDGKSTLIGRLLYDSKSIFTDQLEAIERTSVQRGTEFTDLALLTDGLRAERETGHHH